MKLHTMILPIIAISLTVQAVQGVAQTSVEDRARGREVSHMKLGEIGYFVHERIKNIINYAITPHMNFRAGIEQVMLRKRNRMNSPWVRSRLHYDDNACHGHRGALG